MHSKGTIELIMVAMLAEKHGIKMNIREVPFAQQEVALSRGDQVVRMVKAFINTNRWIMKNQEEAREIIAGKYLKYESKMVAKTVFMKWPLNGEPMTGSLQPFAEKMKGLGLIQKAPDVKAFFPTEYIDKALVSVSRVPDPDFERAAADTPAR